MATVRFNKFDSQLDEGVGELAANIAKGTLKHVGNIANTFKEELIKAFFPAETATHIISKLNEISKLKVTKENMAKVQAELEKAEKEHDNLVRDFLLKYYKLLTNIYIPKNTPTDISKISYQDGNSQIEIDVDGEKLLRFIPDNDLSNFKKFIDNYLIKFEEAVRAEYNRSYTYSDNLLAAKMEEKLKKESGFSSTVKKFIDAGAVIGNVNSRKVTIYSQITNFMKRVTDIMRALEKAKRELEKLKDELESKTKVK